MRIIKHKNLKSLKNAWENLENSNPKLVPDMRHDFMKMFNNNINTKLTNFLNRQKYYYYEIVENNETQMIVPIAVKGGKFVSQYSLDYYDVIFKENLPGEKVKEYLESISNIENSPIEILRVNKKCATFNKLNSLVEMKQYNECVRIDFDEDYDKYYNSLSKHARQNLRTSYNRLATDNKTMRFETFYGPINKKLQKTLHKIYLKRRVGRYKNMNPIKKIIYSICDPISNVCSRLDNCFTSIVYIENKPVAFMSGFVFDKEIIIPRLAIDENYSRYSTGIILVNETIKEIQQKGFVSLDLATGTENYKFQMGGISHFSYSFTIGENNEKTES